MQLTLAAAAMTAAVKNKNQLPQLPQLNSTTTAAEKNITARTAVEGNSNSFGE